MNLSQAQLIAAEIMMNLHPSCIQIQIAGSVSRHVPEVKDIEIVYISKAGTRTIDLFGATREFPTTDLVIAEMIDDGLLMRDPDVRRWGPKYKRARHCKSGIVVELFRAELGNWGYILALRTGPARFSKLLVTSAAKNGAMPWGIEAKDGHLWKVGRTQRQQLATPTEKIFFATLHVPHWSPEDRSAEALRQYIKERKLTQHIEEQNAR